MPQRRSLYRIIKTRGYLEMTPARDLEARVRKRWAGEPPSEDVQRFLDWRRQRAVERMIAEAKAYVPPPEPEPDDPVEPDAAGLGAYRIDGSHFYHLGLAGNRYVLCGLERRRMRRAKTHSEQGYEYVLCSRCEKKWHGQR